MINLHRSPTGPAVLVDCPFCDSLAAVDEAAEALACAACGCSIELAADAGPVVLAPAA